jgi:molybdopterin molybdotransferase
MIEELEARQRILAVTPIGELERVSLAGACGRVAMENFVGRVDLPGFDNSAMDGYAVRAAEASLGARLSVAGEQPAGRDLGLTLGAGTAIRIFTGAPMPAGADAVIMQEDVDRVGEEIVVNDASAPGDFVRRRGADVCVGQKLFGSGDRIGAARVALVASQGIDEVTVAVPPRVSIVTTGDELLQPGVGVELHEGEIFNSNAAMLAALVGRFDGVVSGKYHAADEAGELGGTLEAALDTADVVIVAGGVSVGERDLVKEELRALGVESGFWRVRVKPGKPFLFGRQGNKLVFGLPGNPVSAFTTFLLFVAPALRRWSGATADSGGLPLPMVPAVAGEELKNGGDRPHYLRGRVDAEGRFLPVGMQQSHAIFGLSRADAMTRLEAGQSLLAGEKLRVWRLDGI